MQIYTEDHEIFRRTFKKFVEKEIAPHVEEWHEKREVPKSIWKKMGDQGYLSPWLDEEYGGAGVGFEYSVIIGEELSKVDVGFAVGVGVHGDIIVPYIASYGTEEQKRKWLPGCCAGDTIMAIGMTEPNTGSDVQAIKTTAIKDGDHYVINGQKTFISNGILAGLVLLACKTDPKADPPHKGVSLIVVEDGTPGFIKSRKLNKLGLHSQDTAELYFEDCRVPVANLIGEEGKGFIYMMQKLQQERLVTVISAQAAAERLVEDAVEYAKTRTAFGRPIGKFQHNAFKLVEMATEVELGRAFLDSLLVDHLEGKDIVKKVSMAKWWHSEMVNRVAYHCLQIHGGYGYMDEYPVSRYYRDVRMLNIAAGTTEIMKEIIARQMGL